MHYIDIVLQKTVMPKVTKTNERFRYVLTYNSIRSRYSLIENALVDTYYDGNVPFLSKDIKRFLPNCRTFRRNRLRLSWASTA